TTGGVPAGAGGKSKVEGAAGGRTALRPAVLFDVAVAAVAGCSNVLWRSSRAFSSSVVFSPLAETAVAAVTGAAAAAGAGAGCAAALTGAPEAVVFAAGF